ncbi:MAG: hypothetical protein HGB32_07835 [Geobacteraceae bacterium]|nr:hypothetical protein [Geobacteraceae bacterium]
MSVHRNFVEYYEKFKTIPEEASGKQQFISNIESAKHPFAVELFLYDCEHGDSAMAYKTAENTVNTTYRTVQNRQNICKSELSSFAYTPLYLFTVPIDIVTSPFQLLFLNSFKP